MRTVKKADKDVSHPPRTRDRELSPFLRGHEPAQQGGVKRSQKQQMHLCLVSNSPIDIRNGGVCSIKSRVGRGRCVDDGFGCGEVSCRMEGEGFPASDRGRGGRGGKEQRSGPVKRADCG